MQMQTLNIHANCKRIMGSENALDPRAAKLFEKRYNKTNWITKWTSKKIKPLLVFENAYRDQQLVNQHDLGTSPIRIDCVVGTMNRLDDFDADFAPTQRHTEDRWLKVATAMLRGRDLPPIELIKVDESYYVKDGHHRLSVACALGLKYLDAHIVEYKYRDRNSSSN